MTWTGNLSNALALLWDVFCVGGSGFDGVQLSEVRICKSDGGFAIPCCMPLAAALPDLYILKGLFFCFEGLGPPYNTSPTC